MWLGFPPVTAGSEEDLLGKVIGGAEGDRTLDLRIANATLSQLSYRPNLIAVSSTPANGARF